MFAKWTHQRLGECDLTRYGLKSLPRDAVEEPAERFCEAVVPLNGVDENVRVETGSLPAESVYQSHSSRSARMYASTSSGVSNKPLPLPMILVNGSGGGSSGKEEARHRRSWLLRLRLTARHRLPARTAG